MTKRPDSLGAKSTTAGDWMEPQARRWNANHSPGQQHARSTQFQSSRMKVMRELADQLGASTNVLTQANRVRFRKVLVCNNACVKEARRPKRSKGVDDMETQADGQASFQCGACPEAKSFGWSIAQKPTLLLQVYRNWA